MMLAEGYGSDPGCQEAGTPGTRKGRRKCSRAEARSPLLNAIDLCILLRYLWQMTVLTRRKHTMQKPLTPRNPSNPASQHKQHTSSLISEVEPLATSHAHR